MKPIEIILCSALAAMIAAYPACAADNSRVDPEAWDALIRKYEKNAASSTAPPPVSDDEAVRAGSWDALARKYDNKFASQKEAAAPSPEELASWWKTLGDETLEELIMDALSNNRDLQAARGKVMEARAALGISRSAVLPWLDSEDTWVNNKSSDNSANQGARAEITKLAIDASWEIDIFGARRDSIDAASAALEAEHAAMRSAWVTLSSEVALNYLSLRTLQARLVIANRNLALQEDTLSMLASKHDAGLADSLALNQARYTVEGTKASIPPIKAGVENIMNALAILAGRVPGSIGGKLSEFRPLPKPSFDMLIGIPADSLRQRPDVRAAERALAAQVLTRKSAEKDLLPKFYLMGSIGLETLSGGSIFSGDSFGFSFGPRITLPIFHGGAIRKNIQVQTAREEQLLAAYEGTVLNAVAEVRNALAENTQEIERNKSLIAGIEAAQAALDIANDRYRNGLTDFSNVISAQAALLSLEDQLTVSEGQMTSNVVRIFKALGGGWAPMAEEALGELHRQ
ncbi:MAG: TolC family protein [Synergistaceae bacterium]|jgi:NodT family efflux transporter outer membrane factor (OMF) lipoprotein|nr:TolC family protein [Synergistaceae bacterium]